eukprot:TRINITY_DN12086_c0_g1_i1.p1 TRINITY_DN12086_c0_g1~~TRINITY_DN12086_c0_g1_i1.p1  ORF type:complete len:160 (-),score=44.24 TRINITY_DN12086_c0_g1_i1:86-565(-)
MKIKRKLGYTAPHRKMLMRIQVTQLIKHERIKTTLAKAMEVKKFADRVIRWAKMGTPHAKKMAFSFINETAAVEKLFSEFGERYKDRQGGYTRVMKAGYRTGDAAAMAIIEYVDNPLPPLPAAVAKRVNESKSRIQKLKDTFQETETQAVLNTPGINPV